MSDGLLYAVTFSLERLGVNSELSFKPLVLAETV